MTALGRLDFAVSLHATRVRRAHAELYAVVLSALHDGVDPKLLAASAGFSLPTIHRMSLWSDDDECGGMSPEIHLAQARSRRTELQRAIDAKAHAEKRKRMYLVHEVAPLE